MKGKVREKSEEVEDFIIKYILIGNKEIDRLIKVKGKKMDIYNKYLGEKVIVKIDRALGTKHPNHDFIYLLNYGYIPDTVAEDGEEIDAYVIGEFEELEEYEGYVVAIIKRLNDIENKLVVCKEKDKYSKEQIEILVEFQERFFETEIIVIK